MARSMVLQKTNLVGLLLPRVSGIFHQRLFYLLESMLEEKGYKVIVCNIKDNESSEISYLNLLQQKEVDGIILCHESYSEKINSYLNASTTPVVQCAISIPDLKWPAFHIDACRAVHDGISHLTSLGHRKIGMVCGDAISGFETDPQIRGYIQALEEADIPLNRDYIVPGSFSLGSGCQVTEDLISTHPELTAVFYVGDEMAIGGYRALAAAGREVGKDVDVIGYDGIEIGEFVEPSLATISQPVEEIAAATIEALLAYIDGEEEDLPSLNAEDLVLRHSLRAGASCTGRRFAPSE